MKYFTIFGNPVAHSISPRMQNLAFEGLEYNGIYTRYLLENGDKLKETFLNLKLSGANVTVPHKESAYRACDEVEGIAKDIKAVNTLVLKDKKIVGYNTDAPGFITSIKDFFPLKSALILGAGGTAKALSWALRKEGVNVDVLNRSENRLEYFKQNGFEAYSWDNLPKKEYELIVNTTSAGLSDDSLPLDENVLKMLISNAKYAYDVIYHKITPFIHICKENGLKCKDGKDMLLYQGVYAFKHFSENKFNEDEIVKYMKEVFRL